MHRKPIFLEELMTGNQNWLHSLLSRLVPCLYRISSINILLLGKPSKFRYVGVRRFTDRIA